MREFPELEDGHCCYGSEDQWSREIGKACEEEVEENWAGAGAEEERSKGDSNAALASVEGVREGRRLVYQTLLRM